MKTTIFCALLALALVRCGNALDGDAKTDTTTLVRDTGNASAVNDTATHVNSNIGETPRDTMTQNTKGDVRSSSSANPSGRATTTGNTAHQR